jgi:hypothetical protein
LDQFVALKQEQNGRRINQECSIEIIALTIIGVFSLFILKKKQSRSALTLEEKTVVPVPSSFASKLRSIYVHPGYLAKPC